MQLWSSPGRIGWIDIIIGLTLGVLSALLGWALRFNPIPLAVALALIYGWLFHIRPQLRLHRLSWRWKDHARPRI